MMSRKEFITQMGLTSAVLPICLGVLHGCSKDGDSFPAPPTNVDFALDVSSGALSNNGGYAVSNGIIVGRTLTGDFIAVSAACTHQGTTVQYVGSSNTFHCPNHGSNYSASGAVTNGPATKSLVQYNTTLTGTSLRVFSA